MGRVAAISFIVAFVVIIACGAFSSVLFDRAFYEKEYEKNGAYGKIGKNLTLAVTDNLFNYFHGKGELTYFSLEERSHLSDVRKVIWGGYVAYGAAVVVLILSLLFIIKGQKKRKGWAEKAARRIARLILFASLAAIALVVLFGVLSFLDFKSFFMGFHKVFFPQGNYTFPDYYPLIVLYPQEFFEDAAFLVGLRMVVAAAVTAAASGVAMALSRRKA